MPATYEPIATTTLSSAQASITFSSIPNTYTDLRLIISGQASTNGYAYCLRFNSDTATNYSVTYLYGQGTSANSARQTSQTYLRESDWGWASTTIPGLAMFDVFNYAGSTNKTVLAADSYDLNGSGSVGRTVGLWRSTSAITSIQAFLESGNLATGTTATLYGILKA